MLLARFGMAEVAHLFICLVHRFPMEEVTEAEVIEDKGFQGCIHGRPGSKRQVLFMDMETLDRLGLPPGVVRENVTTRELDFRTLAVGQRLQIGESLFEITGPCVPCSRMDQIRAGLREELRGRRGWLCGVVRGGKVRRGDRVDVLAPAASPAD